MIFDRQLAEIHERIGDEYLLIMRSHGLEYGPTVAWMTYPPFPEGATSAMILWDDGPEMVQGFPRSALAAEVARRVLAVKLSAN